MYKCLVSGGCSFAYGFNLKDRDKRYAKIISQRLNMKLIDVSAAGMTNEFISAATVSGINKALQQYKSDEILVIIGWTTTERFEYFNKRIGRIMSGYVNLSHHKHGSAKREEDREISIVISDHMWDPSYGYYKLLNSFNYVHNFCKAQGVTVIHKHNVKYYPAHFPDIKLNNTEVRNSDLIELCLTADAKEHFDRMTVERSFQDFVDINRYWNIPGKDTHPNERGNMLWAERLMVKHPELMER